MHKLIFLIVCVSIFQATIGDETCASYTKEKGHQCALSFFLQSRDRWLPNQASQFEQFCSEKLKDLECLEKYTKCSSNTTERYKKYSAEMLNQVVRSARRSMESLCQSDQLKTIFLQNMKCTNTEKLRPLDVCADKITEVVIKLKEHNAYPLRGLCCARGLFELCVKNVIENACGEIVAKDFYTYSMTMLRGMLSIVELECDGQNQCSEMEIVSQTFSAKSVAQYNRSVIVEAIELIAQHFLGDDEDR